MQLSIEPVDQSGGCAYGYACVYTDTISWAAPDQPLPMVRDPRMVFELMFGAGGTPEQRAQRRATDRSILDMLSDQMASLRRSLGPADRQRLDQYSSTFAKSSSASHASKHATLSGDVRELPGAPAGVPDSFDEHVKLMFDLQVLAFQSDTTRVFSFKFGRDASGRVYPLSGIDTGLPQRLAPRRGRGAHQAVQRDQQVPRVAAAVLPREAAGRHGRRRESAREDARHLRLADGQRQPAQPPQLPADPAGPRRRLLEGGVHVKAPTPRRWPTSC